MVCRSRAIYVEGLAGKFEISLSRRLDARDSI